MFSRSHSRPARHSLAAVAVAGLGVTWLLGGLYLVWFFSLHGLPADTVSRVQTPHQALAVALVLLNVALLALVAPGALLVRAGLRLRPR
jgi:hypothetical protein